MVGYSFAAGGPVAAATIEAVTLSGEQTIDGVLTSASRILVKDQADPAENGIYVTAAGAWVRASDMAAAAEVQATAVAVSDGTGNGGRVFITYSAVTALETDPILWIEGPENSGLQGQIDGKADSVHSHAIADVVDLQGELDGKAPANTFHNVPFSVSDAAGNRALELDAEGGFRTKKLDVSEGVKFGPAISGYAWSVSDGGGNVILGVDTDGRLVADFSLVGEDLTQGAADYFQGGDENYDYSVNHVFTCGQSLSVGQALPVQSGAQNYDNLMFYRGMRPQYDFPAENAPTWYQSLVPAIEIVSPNPSWSSVLGETPAMGTGDMVKQLALAEDEKAYTSHEYKLLLSAPGWGATTIAQLSQGTSHYDRMVEQAGYGLSLANADGKTYAVQAVTWTQGESDYLAGTTQAAYLAALNTLIADTNTDVKAATGQVKDIVYIGYQIATHLNYAADDVPDIAMAQLECEGSNPLFFIATPMYHLPYQDGGHLTGVGSRWLGGYYGLAYKRIVIDGTQWRPLQPLSTVVQSNLIEAVFHVPHGKLAFDTAGVPARPDMGFELVDSVGGALAISTVEIVDADRVRITAAAAVPAGAKLRYGWSGATNAGQGNLRDTQGDDIVFDPNGINKPMHNWCVIFEKEL